jgi:hypothetical protein
MPYCCKACTGISGATAIAPASPSGAPTTGSPVSASQSCVLQDYTSAEIVKEFHDEIEAASTMSTIMSPLSSFLSAAIGSPAPPSPVAFWLALVPHIFRVRAGRLASNAECRRAVAGKFLSLTGNDLIAKCTATRFSAAANERKPETPGRVQPRHLPDDSILYPNPAVVASKVNMMVVPYAPLSSPFHSAPPVASTTYSTPSKGKNPTMTRDQAGLVQLDDLLHWNSGSDASGSLLSSPLLSSTLAVAGKVVTGVAVQLGLHESTDDTLTLFQSTSFVSLDLLHYVAWEVMTEARKQGISDNTAVLLKHPTAWQHIQASVNVLEVFPSPATTVVSLPQLFSSSCNPLLQAFVVLPGTMVPLERVTAFNPFLSGASVSEECQTVLLKYMEDCGFLKRIELHSFGTAVVLQPQNELAYKTSLSCLQLQVTAIRILQGLVAHEKVCEGLKNQAITQMKSGNKTGALASMRRRKTYVIILYCTSLADSLITLCLFICRRCNALNTTHSLFEKTVALLTATQTTTTVQEVSGASLW